MSDEKALSESPMGSLDSAFFNVIFTNTTSVSHLQQYQLAGL